MLSTVVRTSHTSITHMHFLYSFQKCIFFCFSLVFKSSLFSLHLKFKSLNTFFKLMSREDNSFPFGFLSPSAVASARCAQGLSQKQEKGTGGRVADAHCFY